MKFINKRIGLIILTSTLIFSSCKKYEEEKFDFASTSKAPYVELKSKTAKTVVQGNAFSFTVQVRTAFTVPVTVYYAISGGAAITGSMTLPANLVESASSVTIPAGTVPTGSTSVALVFKIISATRANGQLTVGRLNPDTEKINVTVTK